MQQSDIERRYWLIELIVYWEGRVATTHLNEFFGIGRQQASKDIGSYKRAFPRNLEYDAHSKGYVPTADFQREHISGDVTEYLSWMTGMRAHASAHSAACQLPHLALAHPPRTVPPELMRPLLRAIRQQRRVEVDYVSVSNPSRDGRIIVPHTFVSTGLRWHLRAYCEKSQGYRDFVLSRFRGIPELLDRSAFSSAGDDAWNTEVCLRLQPDPRLNAAKKDALIHDYAMHSGELQLRTRAALAHYLLLEMQVNIKMLDGNPEAQQLVLVNLDEIKPWLFS